jgi:hypothetical protein
VRLASADVMVGTTDVAVENTTRARAMGYGGAMRVGALLTVLFLLSPGLRAEAPARPRVLVLEPASKSFDPATTSTIAGLIIVELGQDPRLDVISAAEVQRLAELEGDRQAVGCGDESCLAELAGAMGARYVVFGDVGSLGSLVVMNLNLFDNQTARAIHRVTVQADGIAKIPAALPGPIAALRQALIASTTTTATPPTTTTTTAPATTATTPPPAGGAGVPILPWVLVGGGAALAIGGLAGDVFSPTSINGTYDVFDFAWPIGYGLVAPVLIGVGGVLLFSTDDGAAATTTTGGR